MTSVQDPPGSRVLTSTGEPQRGEVQQGSAGGPAVTIRSHGSNGLAIAAAVERVAPVAVGSRSSAPVPTLASSLHDLGRTMPDAPAYHVKVNGKFVPTTWGQYSEQVTAAAKGLMALGAKRGDCVTIYAFNCEEWPQASLAAGTIGVTSTGAYPDLSPNRVAHTINNSESRIVFVENLAMWSKLEPALGELGNVEHFIILDGAKPNHPKALTWREFNAGGAAVPDADVQERARAIQSNDTASLIYTSGTTGAPKGVELSPKNLMFTAKVFQKLADLTPEDRVICFLRLGHIADHMFSIGGPVVSGMQVFHSCKADLKEDLKTVRPTIFFAVPLVWDEIASGIEAKVANLSKTQKWLKPWVDSVGSEAAKARALGREPSGLGFWLANKLVFKKALEEAGLDKVRFAVSGGGALKASTARTLANLGIPILNAYGQSETAGIIACARPGVWREGSLGKAPDGGEIKIAPSGEILVRGDNTCKGYFKNPEATAKLYAHGDGWLATGDVGKLDAKDYLDYDGRAGRIDKLSTGEYVNPEDHEKLMPGGVVADSVTVFKNRRFVTTVVVLDPRAAKRLAGDGADPVKSEAVRKAIQERIDQVNSQVDPHARIRKFFIVDRPLSADDGGEIGSTGKLIPDAVAKAFATQIEEMYQRRN